MRDILPWPTWSLRGISKTVKKGHKWGKSVTVHRVSSAEGDNRQDKELDQDSAGEGINNGNRKFLFYTYADV